ncbi:MAG TPA: hypothetical protein VM899_11985 [Rubellimicrobium sp.]|nr:hypothetical protein [Rubellimicrobium sp.]
MIRSLALLSLLWLSACDVAPLGTDPSRRPVMSDPELVVQVDERYTGATLTPGQIQLIEASIKSALASAAASVFALEAVAKDADYIEVCGAVDPDPGAGTAGDTQVFIGQLSMGTGRFDLVALGGDQRQQIAIVQQCSAQGLTFSGDRSETNQG